MKSRLKRKKSKKCEGFHVIKQLPDGAVVKEYHSLIEAQEGESISHQRLVRVIRNREEVNGYIFTSPAIKAISSNNQATTERRSRPVFKVDQAGKRVHEYVNVKAAARAEGIAQAWLRNIICRKTLRQGYTFELGPMPEKPALPIPQQIELRQRNKKQPWEVNGMFNINGWAALAIPV